MNFLLGFAVALFVGVLISDYASRSVLSIAVLFLATGFLLHYVGAVQIAPTDPIFGQVVQIAIFAVLFTDGMRVGFDQLRGNWKLPTRALAVGMPLTLLGTALLAHFVAGADWMGAFVVGAALSPTDPVLAEAIIGRAEVPARIRSLLNVESGVNDGLAAPAVIVLLVAAGGFHGSTEQVVLEMIYGVGLGIVLPWVVTRISQFKMFGTTGRYYSLGPFAVGLLLFTISLLVHANIFLAAFTGGIALRNFGSDNFYEAFEEFGDLIAELLKLGALMLFGSLLSVQMFRDLPWAAYLFAVFALLLVRPAALVLALARTGLSRKEWLTTAWFGPKGFSSVIYGLYILQSRAPDSTNLARLVGLVVGLSIVVHSSSDVLLARWFKKENGEDQGREEPVEDAA